jgi:hypothetical protein
MRPPSVTSWIERGARGGTHRRARHAQNLRRGAAPALRTIKVADAAARAHRLTAVNHRFAGAA